MPTLEDASDPQLARLLALYPLAQLKETWNDIKADDKVSLCEAIVDAKPVAQIASFIDAAFGTCKQHVYLSGYTGTAPAFPVTIAGDGERVKKIARGWLYVAQSSTEVVLLNPYADETIEFLWPIRIEISGKHVIVRFVVLEKDIASYFDRQSLTKKHGISEEEIVAAIAIDMGLEALDVHKGMKHLWDTEYMDCFVTKYKKTKSSAAETVNRGEKKGIRENDPSLFKILMKSDMRESLFFIEKDEVGVNKVGIDPSIGRLSFLQYSAKPGAVDSVIRKILQSN